MEPARVVVAVIPLLADDRVGQIWLMHSDDAGPCIGYAIVTWSYSIESGGRGLGSGLLQHAIAEAAAAGAQAMFLETEAHNAPARRFYQRHGFVTEESVWMSRVL